MRSSPFVIAAMLMVALSGCEKKTASPPTGLAAASSAIVEASEEKEVAADAVRRIGVANPDMVPADGPYDPTPETARSQSLLPTERRVLVAEGLSVERVAAIIRTDAFNAFVVELASESAKDPLAQDVATVQRVAWERRLGGAALHEFACGLSVCAGSVRTHGDEFEHAEADFLKSGPSGGSLAGHLVDLGDGEFEYRFVTSHDPEAQGGTFRNPPGT